MFIINNNSNKQNYWLSYNVGPGKCSFVVWHGWLFFLHSLKNSNGATEMHLTCWSIHNNVDGGLLLRNSREYLYYTWNILYCTSACPSPSMPQLLQAAAGCGCCNRELCAHHSLSWCYWWWWWFSYGILSKQDLGPVASPCEDSIPQLIRIKCLFTVIT